MKGCDSHNPLKIQITPLHYKILWRDGGREGREGGREREGEGGREREGEGGREREGEGGREGGREGGENEGRGAMKYKTYSVLVNHVLKTLGENN